MNEENFRKQIEDELKKMSKEEVVFFAWLCAIRALPFLGAGRQFDFWEEKDRKKYLYAIFRALDITIYQYKKKANAYKVDITGASYATTTKATTLAVYAVDAASYAYSALTASPLAAIVYAIDTADAACYAAGKLSMRLQNIILLDIEAIKNRHYTFNKNLKLYGEIWDNFLYALKKEGCKYWGELYKDIFGKSFKLDEEVIKRRINVAFEIQDLGAAAVANYLEELEKGAKYLNEARIIILGEKGAGKTCLARRLKNPEAEMTTDKDSTAGVDTTLWKPKHDDINIHIWDFAGHTITHAVHKFFLSERCLYILVYDGRTEERNRIEYWLNQIKNYGGKSDAFILVNKRDSHIPDIPIKNLKDKYPIAGNYTLSIQDDKNLLDVFRKDVIEYIKNNPSWSNQMIPANYFNVKKKLEQHFAKNPEIEHISLQKFNQIAKVNGIADPAELLKSLHALGICLRYEEMGNFDTLVLNPEWISHGIYKIINWVREQGGHSINLTNFSNVFENDFRYPEGKYPFLHELMKRYELAYETENKDCLIIPHLLQEDRPDTLPDFPESESLKFLYQAKQPLPPNSISQFIVRHNKEIKSEGKEFLVWRHGVVLEDGIGSIALVREWEDERQITVWVKGKDKTVYLDKLRETLNNIFDDIFKSNEINKPELQYRIVRPEPITDVKEKPLSVDQIAVHVSQNKLFLDSVTRRFIDLKPTAKAFNINVFNYYNPTFITYQGRDFTVDNSTQTFNFNDCNIALQRNLNELIDSLKDKGKTEYADELEDAVKALSEVEQCQTHEEVKRKGFINKLKRIVEDLGDENSKLYKTIKGIKYGVSIAQDIAKGYNDIAQWCGLPQVPKPFLGKE